MDETRITYTKAGEQERDVIIESAAPVDREKSTLTNPFSCNTDDTSDDHMDVTRTTYTKVDEQERDVIIKSPAPVDHEKSTLMNVNEQQGISPKLHMMALIVAATAATFANAMKELLTDKLRYYIFEKTGDKNLIKYMLSGADTGAGVTRVPTEKWTTCNFQFFLKKKFKLFFGSGERQNTQTTKQKQIPK